ncbi:MAG: DNA mismatch repair protein MutS, partial [Clostridia bacterium]|nr:DNA mismatch repair protein MutS [Clostridia bacterium]
QIALIAIMAHVGCFVPCNSCKMPIIDRIFTRIGASDDLSVGQSTFMVEMVEVATILNNATHNSLLILDEIGRGTSTFDGLSIAWAVMEYIAKNIGAKTLFATHYHELTELEGRLNGVKNYRILIKELNNDIIFLHKIAMGGANKSFGIEVAGLAGVPKEVIKLAKKYNKAIEKTNVNMQLDKPEEVKQLSLFVDSVESEVVKILRETNINNTTPIQALAILEDLKYKVEE